MARVSRDQPTVNGLYAQLARREELVAEGGGWMWQTELPGTVYRGSEERLAAFRDRRPVRLRAFDLPKGARPPAQQCRYRMAVVYPDDRIELAPETAEDVVNELEL